MRALQKCKGPPCPLFLSSMSVCLWSGCVHASVIFLISLKNSEVVESPEVVILVLRILIPKVSPATKIQRLPRHLSIFRAQKSSSGATKFYQTLQDRGRGFEMEHFEIEEKRWVGR